jgi:hypothetical protein
VIYGDDKWGYYYEPGRSLVGIVVLWLVRLGLPSLAAGMAIGWWLR